MHPNASERVRTYPNRSDHVRKLHKSALYLRNERQLEVTERTPHPWAVPALMKVNRESICITPGDFRPENYRRRPEKFSDGRKIFGRTENFRTDGRMVNFRTDKKLYGKKSVGKFFGRKILGRTDGRRTNGRTDRNRKKTKKQNKKK